MVDFANVGVTGSYVMTRVTDNGNISQPEALLTPHPGERAYVGAGDSGVIVFDLGEPVEVDVVAVLYGDSTSSDSFSVACGPNPEPSDGSAIFSASEPCWAGPTASQVLPGYRHGVMFMPGGVTARYWRIVLPPGRSFGRIMIGHFFFPVDNPDYGSTSWGFEELPEPEVLDSGVTVLQELPEAPYFEATFTWATQAEVEYAWTVFARFGYRGVPLLVVRRPDPNDFRHSGVYYGVVRLQPMVAADYDMFEVKLKVRSMV